MCDCVSSEWRVYKGHATKLCDWRGLCHPEPLRLGGKGMTIRETVEAPTIRRTNVFAQGLGSGGRPIAPFTRWNDLLDQYARLLR